MQSNIYKLHLISRLWLKVMVILLVAATQPGVVCIAFAEHKDFEYTTLQNTVRIDHLAFSGASEHLDGPCREAMHRGLWAVTCDTAGNFYFYEIVSNCIRALRKRDGRMFTITGTRYISSGTPGRGGPADQLNLYHECFIAMPAMAAAGNPLEGTGSLYATDGSGGVVRLWKEKGVWQYERVVGIGKDKPAPGASAISVTSARITLVATPNGDIGLILGSPRTSALYWLRDGKLVPAYDHQTVEKKLGTTFYCRGIDGMGNFVGSAGGEYNAAESCIVVVSPDGKNVRKVPTPYPPQWTICPDAKRERWFFRATDDYTIQYVDSDGKAFRLLRDGTWKLLPSKCERGGEKDALNWSRGITLPDGRYAGWNGRGGSPVFVATWLEGKE